MRVSHMRSRGADGLSGAQQRARLEPARGAQVRGAEQVHEEVRELGARVWRGGYAAEQGTVANWGDVLFARGEVHEEQQCGEEDKHVRGDVEGAGRAADVAGEDPRLEEREQDDGGPEPQDVCRVRRGRHDLDARALYMRAGQICVVRRGHV